VTYGGVGRSGIYVDPCGLRALALFVFLLDPISVYFGCRTLRRMLFSDLREGGALAARLELGEIW
jgi:hypothetical protein